MIASLRSGSFPLIKPYKPYLIPMKKLICISVISALAASLSAQTSILVDFGQVDLPSGPDTDPNGYHWNNPVVLAAGEAKGNWIGWEMLSETEKTEQPWAEVVEYWGAYVGYPYFLVDDLVDQTGASTGSSLTVRDVSQRFIYDGLVNNGGFGWAGHFYGDDLGPIPTDTGYAATATADSWYVNFDFRATLVVDGLDDAKTYTVKVWAGQVAGTDRPSKVGVNDLETQLFESYANVGTNPEDYATFENVSPVNGEITITFEQGVPEDNLLPNGHFSTLEIIGDFSGGAETWNGYEVDDSGWVDTGAWMGIVNVLSAPWVYSLDLAKYAYVMDDSGWVYIPQ